MKKHTDVKTVNGKRVATPEYRSWQMMKNRCQNPNATDYKHYGERGITFCKRWAYFVNFLADMGRRPSISDTLERRDVNKNYTPNNCYWACRKTQSRNRRYCRLNKQTAIKIREKYATGNYRQMDLAKEYKVSQTTISQIIRGITWV